MSSLQTDEKGYPVLLANVPGSGLVKRDANARSGNPNHDTRSGKFGSGGKPKRVAKTIDKVVVNAGGNEALKRYYDAVRDAAREYDNLSEGDIKDFLSGRVKDISKVDLQAFMVEVKNQRVTDVTDLLHTQLVKGAGLLRSRRTVKLTAPKGFLAKALNGLDDASVGEVMRRLEARGHDAEEVEYALVPKIKKEDRRETVKKERDNGR